MATQKAPIFHGRKFILTRTLSNDLATEVRRLIEEHGGVISSSPAGAIEIVDYDELDSRRPEWVSVDYIYDSVAEGALQDSAKYSGAVFSSKPSATQLKGRVRYTVEDDARLLLFAKVRGWESMKSVPASTWKLAESSRVTNHSWQSMHERFRKQLKSKTPKEQRIIIARAVEIIRMRLQRSNDGEAIKEEAIARDSSSIATPANVGPTTPTSSESVVTPVTSLPPRRCGVGTPTHQKRKRGSFAIGNFERSSQEDEEEDVKTDVANVNDTGGARVVFFRSAWAEYAADPRNSFKVSDNCSHASETCTEDQCLLDNGSSEKNGVDVRFATEDESDAIICQLQLETGQKVPVVVNALYYCNGNVDVARAFLKGTLPSNLRMWSQEDDLLVAKLIVDKNTDRSAIKAALAHGKLDSMRISRDTDSILDRIHFLL
ncbi:Rap1 Myb domain [Plasmopara halstedii]|uniref:Telomeric repeat-binding factor 2-interacting protein 1 n=1 Tax=Plasmopara halstedii TaxID=4781 RepID=A0A0P1ANA8_PLAHL|nr:Rap1 Myb domain [Plasmopara halstedii]CEG42477.1 Rap1 Myb domain [Plasmopara halstedii]|eukprot:XP_024578846.1 Rap1 Myb domain [Plasmopara halstedii]